MNRLYQIISAGIASLPLLFSGCTCIKLCERKTTTLNAIVVKENFLPSVGGFFGRPDTYVMVVEFPDGARDTVEFREGKARRMDALFDVGSKIRYEKIISDCFDASYRHKITD